MKVTLSGLKQMAVSDGIQCITEIPDGWVSLNVTHCAICRTDAKMWMQGHRDLHLPRIPGHEIVAVKDNRRYAVWPGVVCGNCRYCKSGHENLCDSMRIIGFHLDGGFCDTIIAPEYNCIPIAENIDSEVASFAEPVGCIINAFKNVKLTGEKRMLVCGAGTMGILTALIALQYGVKPVILEKNETKIAKAYHLRTKHNLNIVKQTDDSHFDIIVNCCSDPIAFISSIPKTSKGASILFFSGLEKNVNIESNLLNIIHYKELSVIGCYGLTKNDMETGLQLISQNPEPYKLLIEDVVPPESVPDIISQVLTGEKYKYVIAFGKQRGVNNDVLLELEAEDSTASQMFPDLSDISITEPTTEIRTQAQQKIDSKTKPLGALGIIEQIAVQMCCIQSTLSPTIKEKAMIVFAADHGIAEEGVSAYPQEVTRQMVQNFLNGGAAINVICNASRLDLSIVDIGVKGSLPAHPQLISRKVSEGTRNFAIEPAMSENEAVRALKIGMDVFNELYSSKKIDILGLGEMGIANTTAATAIISIITGADVSQITGGGTGVDNQGLQHKIKVLRKALQYHKPKPDDPIDILCKTGGFEIGGMAGAALAAASKGCAVVLDGLISTAAGLLAFTINPSVAHYFIAGHKSVEKGQQAALHHMKLTPVLDLDMRLGEGTGAALTINLVDVACRIINEMASFEDAGVSTRGSIK